MKILGRFESRAQREARQAAQAQLQVVREEYGHYCKSNFTTVEQALLHFEALIRHPMVQHVAFATIDGYRFFLIGTTHVTIKKPTASYNIGEFIIRMHRSRHNEEQLKPTLLVENVTTPNCITGGARYGSWGSEDGQGTGYYFAHPHVNGNPGEFCMSTGSHALNRAMVEGDLYEAFLVTISALQSAGPGAAFHDLDNWPIA